MGENPIILLCKYLVRRNVYVTQKSTRALELRKGLPQTQLQLIVLENMYISFASLVTSKKIILLLKKIFEYKIQENTRMGINGHTRLLLILIQEKFYNVTHNNYHFSKVS